MIHIANLVKKYGEVSAVNDISLEVQAGEIMNFLVMPIFFLSGALFPLTGLPRALDLIARVDPLSYGVDGLRSSMTGSSHFGLPTDFAVLLVLTIALLVVGSRLFPRIQV